MAVVEVIFGGFFLFSGWLLGKIVKHRKDPIKQEKITRLTKAFSEWNRYEYWGYDLDPRDLQMKSRILIVN